MLPKLLLSLGCLALTLAKPVESGHSWDSLSITTKGRYLSKRVDGSPFFWQADTAWEIFHRLNKTDVDLYLSDRAEKGFNIIQAVAVAELNGTTHSNYYNQLPLVNQDPTQPIEEYFEYVDYVIDRAADYGILVALVPTWGRYVNCGWRGEPKLFNVENAKEFGRFISNRYPGLPKIIGGDSNGDWACDLPDIQEEYEDNYESNPDQDPYSMLPEIEDTRDVWSSMVDGMKEGEEDLFVIYHPTNTYLNVTGLPLAYGSNYLNGTHEVSMNAVQSGHSVPGINPPNEAIVGWNSVRNYEFIEDMRRAFDGSVIDLENHYEGARLAFEADQRYWTASEVRHGLYNGFFAGSAGITYGAHSIWQFYDPIYNLDQARLYIEPQNNLDPNDSWRNGLHFEAAGQVVYLQNLFKDLKPEVFFSMEPDRSFIQSIDGDEDVLAYAENRRVGALKSDKLYWVYTGFGDAFKVNLSNETGIVSTKWYDTRTGQSQDENSYELDDNNKVMAFYPPTSGTIDNDWVLAIEIQ
ncbi:hypothetical protein E3Q12_03076 [Wallemia mellicola]|nr:hypothetical protein E3Q12_03076 [Wallemia mellicola]